MFKKFNSTIIIALCTAAALIAFAFDQRYKTSVIIPEVAFYLAAAVICLLPVLYALLRRKSCDCSRAAADLQMTRKPCN
jgi:uncharacterized membrane protein YqjE